MSSVQRTGIAFVTLFGLLLTLGLAYTVARGCTRRIGNPPYREDARLIAKRAVQLEAEKERMHRRIEFGGYLAHQLAIGALTLASATEQIEPQMRTLPYFEFVGERYYLAPNIHLGTARYLIDRVRRLLEGEPDWWVFVSARLEAEYAAMR